MEFPNQEVAAKCNLSGRDTSHRASTYAGNTQQVTTVRILGDALRILRSQSRLAVIFWGWLISSAGPPDENRHS